MQRGVGVSRTLQLLLRSPATIRHGHGAVVALLQQWTVQDTSVSSQRCVAAPANGILRTFASSGPGSGSDEEHTDGEDLSFTTAGGVAEGWLPDAGQQDPADAPADEQPAPEQGEAEQQAPEEQQGPGQQAALQPEADPTSSEAVMELLRHGKPEEALIRMAQRFGSGLQQQSFEDTISQASERDTRRAERRAKELALQQEQQAKRVPLIDSQGRAYGTGKRKCSVARVWIRPGLGRMTINGHQLAGYFGIMQRRLDVLAPMYATSTLGQWDTYATVKGGGTTGQAQALRHGIAKALQAMDPSHRPVLRAGGYLTRDNRVVERKKPGKAKARKSFQWVKR